MSTNLLIALIALFAACICAAGFSFLDGIGRSRQTGPSQDPAGPGKNFARKALGPQRDLFGTPFGPHFLTKLEAKYANLPDFRRNLVRGGFVKCPPQFYPEDTAVESAAQSLQQRVTPALYFMNGLPCG